MRGRLSARLSRSVGAFGLCVLLPVLLGCLGIQLGPLGFHIGAGGSSPEPPSPPTPPRVKKETTVTTLPDGSLCQEGEVRVPALSSVSVYYLKCFAGTPHLEVNESGEEGVAFLVTEQGPDHFTVKNTGLLLSRVFEWRARGPVTVEGLPARPVPVK